MRWMVSLKIKKICLFWGQNTYRKPSEIKWNRMSHQPFMCSREISNDQWNGVDYHMRYVYVSFVFILFPTVSDPNSYRNMINWYVCERKHIYVYFKFSNNYEYFIILMISFLLIIPYECFEHTSFNKRIFINGPRKTNNFNLFYFSPKFLWIQLFYDHTKGREISYLKCFFFAIFSLLW